MANDKQCGGNEDEMVVGKEMLTINPLQVGPGCTPTVSSEVCIEANVTVTPTVTPGTPTVNCVGDPFSGSCESMGFTPSETGSCTFTFSQVLCVNTPLTFDADVDVVAGNVACGNTLNQANCENSGAACTLTRGFFANHEEETLQLLALAPGGQIVLGVDALGFSFTVNAANIDSVLEGNTPGGPSPQYQQLYTQLLTANLNVLNGAGCTFATNTINLANTFLSQPTQNNPLASQIQEMLATYNEGNAPGCPGHCPE